MDGELISAEEFFNTEPELGSYTTPTCSRADLKSFEKMKIRMVMRINKCDQKSAVKMIRDRAEANARIKAEREQKSQAPWED